MHRFLFFCQATAVTLALAFPSRAESVADAARSVEADLGGRVGVLVREHGAQPLAVWRADERFPMSSTFKAPLCAAILARVDAGKDRLDRIIPYGIGDLVTYSPVTEAHAGEGMTLGELCAATMKLSDNTAANLLLATIGGPEGFNAFVRGLGDEATRLDRWETELNEALPGDPRDTTTPTAITNTLERLLLGQTLAPASKSLLEAWMRENEVADPLIRASLPEGWIIADRTGAGGNGSRGIISVIWTPEGNPWLATIYMTGNEADMATRNFAIARIGAAIVEEVSGQ